MLLKRLLLICLISPFGALSKKLPDWVLTPPNDSKSWFYSVGSGASNKLAQQSALEDLSLRLTSNVTSQTQSFISSSPDGQISFFENDIKQVSEKYDFKNLTVQQSQLVDGHHFVLLKVDKANFFNDIKKQVKAAMELYLPADSDTTANKLSKAIDFQWRKRELDKKISLLKAYRIPTPFIGNYHNQIKLMQTELRSQLSRNLIIGDDSIDISPLLEHHLTNLANNRDSTQSLTVIAAGINKKQGKTDFHHSISLSLQLEYIFNSNLVYSRTINVEHFADTELQALTSANQQLTNIMKEL